MKNKIISILINILIIHHYIIHINDDKSFIDKVFQYSDIDNHETWVLFLIGMLIGGTI